MWSFSSSEGFTSQHSFVTLAGVCLRCLVHSATLPPDVSTIRRCRYLWCNRNRRVTVWLITKAELKKPRTELHVMHTHTTVNKSTTYNTPWLLPHIRSNQNAHTCFRRPTGPARMVESTLGKLTVRLRMLLTGHYGGQIRRVKTPGGLGKARGKTTHHKGKYGGAVCLTVPTDLPLKGQARHICTTV